MALPEFPTLGSYSLSGRSLLSRLLTDGFRSNIMSYMYDQYSVANKPTPCILRCKCYTYVW